MTDYSNFIKCAEVLMDPRLKSKSSFILKCLQCEQYMYHFDEFVSHCLSHCPSKTTVAAGTLSNDNYMSSDIFQVQCENYEEGDHQEFLSAVKEESTLEGYGKCQRGYCDETNRDIYTAEFDNHYQNRRLNLEIKQPIVSGNGQNNENTTCENCKRLERKVDNLQESINILNRTIMSVLSEMKLVTTNMVRQEATITAATTDFPITSPEMLQSMEDKITADNHAFYVSSISKHWRNSLGKNLESVMHASILMSYNLDGTHGKYRLKDFKKFYSVLLDSIMCLPSTSNKDPEQLLRQAMQLNKKRQFRQLSVKRASEMEEMDS